MKFPASLLALAVFATAGCTTLANRRDVYRPNDASGPYTTALHDGTWKDGVKLTPAKKSGGKTEAPKRNDAAPTAPAPTTAPDAGANGAPALPQQ